MKLTNGCSVTLDQARELPDDPSEYDRTDIYALRNTIINLHAALVMYEGSVQKDDES